MKRLLFALWVLLFIGCGGTTSEDTYTGDNNTTYISNVSEENVSTALEYLNTLRQKAGMIRFSEDPNLTTAAKNHAYYLYVNHTSGHEEEEDKEGFTGQWPSDRAVYAGFLSKDVSENVSVGQSDYMHSIDALFSAIYHRFGFLTTSRDLIGIGIVDKDYVYDMGNSLLNELCSHENDVTGAYYLHVCANDDIIIDTDDYDGAKDNFRKQNPQIILWPYKDAQDIPPVFYNESPDPLPDYNVSGYPVSIKFNEYYFDGNITLKSFKLYDKDGYEITDTRLLDQSSDPNSEFSEYEYALFPLQRLDWNTTYSVSAVYEYNGSEYTLNWSFKTRALDYPEIKITSNDETVYIDSSKTYAYYFVPQNENDLITGYSVSYPSDAVVKSGFIDYNTLWIQVTAQSGDKIVFDLNNGDKLTLIVN